MRSAFIASALTAATLAFSVASASAAPMSTSNLLKVEPAHTKVWSKCYRVCHAYGWCGYGYSKYKCCKVWKRVCH